MVGAALGAWPKPRLEFYHANDRLSAAIQVAKVGAAKGWEIHKVSFTGSMRPALNGGEWVMMERYTGQPIKRGDIISFWRDYDTPLCLHMVADINQRAVYMSGINNRESDGWHPLDSVRYICRLVVTCPK